MTNLPAPEPDLDEAPVDDPFDDPMATPEHDLPPGVDEGTPQT